MGDSTRSHNGAGVAAPVFWRSSNIGPVLVDDDLGMAPSSVFASTSSRDLPWQGYGQEKASREPAPWSYNTNKHNACATLRSPHSTRSAAFASSSERFAKVRPAAGDDGATAPNGSTAARGKQKSAAFASTSRRLREAPSRGPGPGSYSPRNANTAPKVPQHLSAGLASTSARRLPFEYGGGRGTDLQAPPPTQYSPRSSLDISAGVRPKSGAASKGGASLGFTSPRFATGHYNQARNDVPGPGSYKSAEADRRTIGSATNTSGRRLPTQTEGRDPSWFNIRPTPAPDGYRPAASKRGMGEVGGSADQPNAPSASFASSSQRFRSTPATVPGPGVYDPNDGLATASSTTAPQRRALHRSASFGSTSRRFRGSSTLGPGPGAYQSSQDLVSPRGADNTKHSASFASGSERIQLPTNPGQGAPGPGAHGHSNSIGDYARPLRRSASFASTTSRLRGATRDQMMTPPPGAYDGQMSSRGRARATATQRYSIKRLA
jgi:hypothetical protein